MGTLFHPAVDWNNHLKQKPTMTNARSIAHDILVSLEQTGHTLDSRIEEHQVSIDQLARSDRALVHALVYGVQRWRLRLDWIIDYFSTRPGKKMAPAVQAALRMGLFQLYFMDRIPASAAVNTSVDLIKHRREHWAAGFVNAVLRRAAKRAETSLPLPETQNDSPAALSIRHAFPVWLIQRWLDRFGVEQTKALCHAMNTIPAVTLRTNTLRTTRTELIKVVQPEVAEVYPTPFSPEGVSIHTPKAPITTWPAFKEGWFQVQDEAAQLIGHMLAPEPGQSVWDACAGLGTKTIHLAQLMKNQGHLLASDQRRKKLDRLVADTRRLAIDSVQTIVLDLSQPSPAGFTESFDRILVDAPCSGLGVLQKNPDGKWRVTQEDLKQNGQRQGTILAKAATYLKPGGLLVYSVCSVEPEETIDVIEGFLQMHGDFAITPDRLSAIRGGDRLLTTEGYLCTLPHRHAMDGFFAAALVRSPGFRSCF